jgi:hypothetical protein
MKHMVAAVAVVFVALGAAQAQDKNLTGTWKWTVEQGGQTREQTIKLKLDGDKLTGVQIGRNNQETAIGDATYKNGEFSFTVTRERQGQKIVTKYTGKIDGDTIKGKREFERQGEKMVVDWEAKRVKE